MPLYAALARLFPDSYLAKISAVVCAGFALPVLGLLAHALRQGSLDATLLTVTVSGCCAGLVLALTGLRALLDPVFQVARALDRWGRTGQMRVLPEGHGDEIGALMVHANRLIARAQRSLDQPRREADTDPLTGALNRRGAERLLRDAPSGWLLLVDLDGFASVNARHGMAEGDRVLREVVQAGSRLLRRDDLFARIGGDELLVFLPGAPRRVARRIADGLRASIADCAPSEGPGLTASIGLASHPGGEALEEALEIAAAELARAKAEGADRARGAEPP
ncbi:GGDEF domain-containing protein [Histidinibacterium aquaticum]|uniref:diguanylate cyclase n=1 Tax=Histidinibacterium aquaticum TaxID=2613962 RepID=A0A5J5GPW4_9RHOB|nr:GGDEF domain-containing protein [Histidinibacterium aquaticum]KAA9010379.1 GGDEF domain-containing protein [Histidinibacterium aquaticum]